MIDENDKEKLYIVMPAYNEEENIEKVIKEWYPILEYGNSDSKLVVADSGSTDETHNILKKLKMDYAKLIIMSDSGKQHGPKLMALYAYAIQENAEFIFQTDSDGQTNPEEFRYFWNLRKEYDAIIGYRNDRGDGKIRAFIEKIVCALLRFYFHIKVPDANAPFRLMRTNLVEKYLYNLPVDYNLPNIMLTTYFKLYEEKIKFKNITFTSRKAGTNSINIYKIIKIGWKAIADFKKFKKGMNKNEKVIIN